MGPSTLTTLDDALADVLALGFDTSPFIYFIQRNPTYLELTREIFRRLDVGAIQGFTSVITVTEVLTMPKQLRDRATETAYRTLLLRNRHFTTVAIDAAIAERGADLRARYRLRTPDALQIAAALDVGCDAFITNDRALRRVADLRVYALDDLRL